MSVAEDGTNGVFPNVLEIGQCHPRKKTRSVSSPAVAQNIDFPLIFGAGGVGPQEFSMEIVFSPVWPNDGELVSNQLNLFGSFHFLGFPEDLHAKPGIGRDTFLMKSSDHPALHAKESRLRPEPEGSDGWLPV